MSSTMKAAIASVVVFSVIVVVVLIAMNSEDQSPPAPPPADRDVAQAPEVPVDIGDELKTGVVPRKELITTADSVTVTFKISEKGSGTALRRALLTVAPLSEGSRSGPKAYSRAGATHTVDLRPGAWVVRVRCQNFSGERREITVQRDMPATYTFELARGDSITGRIVDEGGKGVGGARVLGLESLHDPDADVEQSLLNLLKLEEQTNTIDSEDVTDADGSYELSGLQRGVRYKIRAIASGFAPGELRKATQAPNRNVNLTLVAGTRLSGVVVDTSGNPVAGATIDAYPEPKNQALFEIIASKSRPPVDSVTSDGRGAFEFTTLGRGTYNFLAHASGYQQMERFDIEVGRTGELRLELELGSAITGVVMSPDDLPIEGARIRFQRVGGTAAARPRQVNIRFGKDIVLSDVEGQFTIDTLADGDYSLIVFHDDYETVRRRGLRSGAEDVTLQMGLGGRITGVVTDNSGSPVAGARVTCTDVADFTKETITESDGHYLISGVQSGRRKVQMTVQSDGFARSRRDVTTIDERDVQEDFELESTAMVFGRVVSSNAEPIVGATVQAKKPHQNGGVYYVVGYGQTDASGQYRIDSVEASEEILVRVKRRGFLEGFSEAVSVPAGTETEVPDIVLELGGEIYGRVVGPEGTPIVGCMVSVRPEGETELTATINDSSQTNSQGEFRLRGLQSGTYDVVAKTNDMLEQIKSGVEVDEGTVTNQVVIELEQGNSVAGQVVDRDGEPVVNATILVRDYARGANELRALSDEQGRFMVKKISSEESVELEVTHPDFSHSPQTVEIGSDLQIVVDRLGSVRGIVKAESGELVGAFSVQPQPGPNTKVERRRVRSKTFNAGDGTFEYPGLPSGVYTIQLRSPSYSSATIDDVRIENGEVVDLGEITLRTGGVIAGRIVDSVSGQGISSARVNVVEGASRFVDRRAASATAGARSRPVQTTDSQGNFAFSGVKGGNLTLRVLHADYLEARIEANSDDGRARSLEIGLDRGGEITGDVLEASGTPRGNTTVFLVGDRASVNQSVRTDSKGKFRFRRVVPGRYTIRAHLADQGGGNYDSVQLEIGAAEEVREIRLQLP